MQRTISVSSSARTMLSYIDDDKINLDAVMQTGNFKYGIIFL
jgi:hypothetical protein